jgi:hypothetical protein
MKLLKSQIRLSPGHPSMLLDLKPKLSAPLVVNHDLVLVDGYRRIQILQSDEIEVNQISTMDIVGTARALNLRSREWTELDGFLWARWEKSLGIEKTPFTGFWQDLCAAPIHLMRLIASGTLQPRQAKVIMDQPARYRDFYIQLLTVQ